MSNCVEIRWHGRGGQGAKTAALLLADVAFQTGKHVQGFPEYGPERMGAPITAYNRISDEAVRVHSNIYDPEYVVVVDETLLETVDVTNGLKKEGAIVINTEKPKEEIIPHLKGYEGDEGSCDGGTHCGGGGPGAVYHESLYWENGLCPGQSLHAPGRSGNSDYRSHRYTKAPVCGDGTNYQRQRNV